MPIPAAPATRSAALPPTPWVEEALSLSVVHPPEGARIVVRDSTFIFGATGTGAASLTINGARVPVARNGAFLAFLPVPPDGVYRLLAEASGARDTLVRRVEVAPSPVSPAEPPVFLTGSAYPRGAWVAAPNEPIDVGFTGRRGGSARLLLPGGESIRLHAAPGEGRVAAYRGVMAARRIMAADTSVPSPAAVSSALAVGPAMLEMIVEGDTVRRELPFNLEILEPARPRVGRVLDPRPIAERGDGQVVARPGAGSGPYHWFWPDGTELAITGERNGQYRVRLTDRLSVWSPAEEIELLPEGTPPPVAYVGNVNIRPAADWIEVRFPLARPLPFRVDEGENRITLEIYGAVSRTDRVDYGALDAFVDRAEWDQPDDRLYRFTLHLNGWAWGHEVFHDRRGMVLRVRRPPRIEAGHPLRGRVIAVDAGHGGPVSGARGPTGLREADVALAVARALARRLEDAGARPLLIRDADVDVPLEERVARATDAGAELLVSIHMDAFGDGVDPYANAGSHVFYFHPRAAGLARDIQVALLDELGLPDRGINRADLALARATWMPAVLTESMFMMIPQWEAAMRDPDVIDRLAEAHARGIEAFLRARATD